MTQSATSELLDKSSGVCYSSTMKIRQSDIDTYRDTGGAYGEQYEISRVKDEAESGWLIILGWLIGAVIVFGPIAIQNYIPMWITYPLISLPIFILGRMGRTERAEEAVLALHDMAVHQEAQEHGTSEYVDEHTSPYVRRLLAKRAGEKKRVDVVYDRAAVQESLRS